MYRVIIVHNQKGVYMFSRHGIPFWSNCDTGGRYAAVTFPSVEDAVNNILKYWNGEEKWENLNFNFVESDLENLTISTARLFQMGYPVMDIKNTKKV